MKERSIAKDIYSSATVAVPWWKLGIRRQLRAESRAEAAERAHAEAERRALERQRHQESLDKQQRQLDERRVQVEHDVGLWVAEEVSRRDRVRADAQAAFDLEWQRLISNDPEAVSAALRPALENERIKVVGSSNDCAVIALAIPDLPEVIADREPVRTPAGRPTLRKRSKTQINRLYLAAVASEVLRIVRIAFARAPGLHSVRCVVVRDYQFGDARAIYAGTFAPSSVATLGGARDGWDNLVGALEHAQDVQISRRGRTQEVGNLDATALPELSVAVARLSSSAPDDPEADRRAAEALLRGPERSPVVSASREQTTQAAKSRTRESRSQRLIRRLSDPDSDSDMRFQAIMALADTPSTEHRDAFLAALDDGDEYVRRTAASALRQLNDPRDTNLFCDMLASSPDSDMRFQAIMALADTPARSIETRSWQPSTMATSTSAEPLRARFAS